MSKAIEGAAMLAGAVAVGALMALEASTMVGMGAIPFEIHLMEALVVGGIGMEAAAAANALTSNRGMGITTRMPAGTRLIIRGMQRIGGVEIYRSTTGSENDQFNYVIVLAGHVCWGIVGLYLDGRLVYFDAVTGTQNGQTISPGGIAFGGFSDGNTYYGPNGVAYNFGDKGNGPLVYCEARYGTQADGDVIAGLTANDPRWAATSAGSPYVGGCTYVYLKIEYDPNEFPSEPEIRFTVMGKPVYDPRSGETTYSNNAALHIADHISDPVFGLGDPNIDQEQLIAAANICDEGIDLAAGGVEAQFALNWHYDTSVSPGDALAVMLSACGGRARQIGGQWNIFPASWLGPSFSWGPGVHTAALQWNPTRSFDELFNRVTGTYIAPNYPYNASGGTSDLYDSNGYFQGQTQNNFPFAWQPTNFPQYACDPQHGYATDEWLDQDSGAEGAWSATAVYPVGAVVTYGGSIWKSAAANNLNNTPETGSTAWTSYSLALPHEVQLQAVCSVSQAQRLAKIMLLRNRYQGTGTFSMSLAAYAMQSMDIMQLDFPFFGWAEKVLEVDQPVISAERDDNSGAVAVRCKFSVGETDPSIYEWSTTEELTVYDVPAASQTTNVPAPPTGLTLVSGANTAVVGADGVVQPRILAEWTPPEDILASQVLGYYRVTGTTPWIPAFTVDASSTSAYIAGIVAGVIYDVQIVSKRASGALSAPDEVTAFTAGMVLSIQTQQGIGIGTLVGEALTTGTANIICNPFSAYLGGQNISYFPGGAVTLTGLEQQTLYYVYVVDPSLTGGNLTPVATTNKADFLGKLGYWLIDSIVTPFAAAGAGARYYPSLSNSYGPVTTQNAALAFDGNLSTYAAVSTAYNASGAQCGCSFSGFPQIALAAAATLTVVYRVATPDGYIQANAGGTTSTLLSDPSTASSIDTQTCTLPIPAGTDLSTVAVSAWTTTGYLELFEIYIQS